MTATCVAACPHKDRHDVKFEANRPIDRSIFYCDRDARRLSLTVALQRGRAIRRRTKHVAFKVDERRAAHDCLGLRCYIESDAVSPGGDHSGGCPVPAR